MTNGFMDRMSDFCFGVLVMTELTGVVVTGLQSTVHRLMKTTSLFLLWQLVINAFCFFVYYVYAPENLYLHQLCDIFEATAVPSCLFLLLSITSPNRLTWRMFAVNALPYATAFFTFTILQWTGIHTAVVVLSTLHAIGILMYSLHAIRDYHLSLLHNYSSLKYIDLRWMKFVVAMYSAWIVLWLLGCLFHYSYAEVAYDIIVAAIVAIIIYSMVRHAHMLSILKQSEDVEEAIASNNTADDIDIASEESSNPSSVFTKRLEYLFANERIYLNPLLTIAGLAKALGSNRTYTSNYINQKLDTTFYDYVNSWRVRHAAALLQDSDLGIEEIARQSGFNSQTSFRKYFKKVYGISASEFKKLRTSGQSVQNTDA